MYKKISIFGIILVSAIAVFFFYQESFAKPNVIMEYIEETNYMVEKFNELYDGEAEFLEQNEADLDTYTTKVLLPGLKEILSDSIAYEEKITNDELKEIHQFHTEAIKYYIDAEEAWMNGETFDQLFTEGDKLYASYEAEFAKLAEKMNVDLSWE